MGFKNLTVALAVIAILCLPGARFAAAQTPTTPGMVQVDLTVDSSKRMLQAWAEIKDMAEGLKGNDPQGYHALYAMQKVVGTVNSHGFPDVETWHRTFYTFMLSAGSIGKEEQFANIPDNLKEAMAHLMPKPENIEVAKQTLEDSEAAGIYEELR